MKRHKAFSHGTHGRYFEGPRPLTWVVFVRCQTFIPQFDRVNLPCVI